VSGSGVDETSTRVSGDVSTQQDFQLTPIKRMHIGCVGKRGSGNCGTDLKLPLEKFLHGEQPLTGDQIVSILLIVPRPNDAVFCIRVDTDGLPL